MAKKEKFYLTTAILYASRKPHVGNDYEIIFTDSIARFERQMGKDVFMLTGSDEHGQKIEDLARENGTDPKKYVDGIVAVLKENYRNLNISNDGFIRTTDERHQKTVQKIFKKLYDQGDIYKSSYEGMYCKPCESFWTEGQLTDGCCPDCGRPVERANEEAYFFKMSKYQDRLMKYIEDHPDFIQPEQRKKEMINNFLKPGLLDLCVSRTSFQWGIPVDFDPKHVVYVWIDALVNYITAMGYDIDKPSAEFKKYWPADVHIVGKDILRFHTIYWPIILMALDLPLPKTVFGHPWLLFGNDKMSKSKGNVLYSDELSSYFSTDGLRYYVLSQMPYDKDGNITLESMISVYNADLANTLGNLVNRTVAMIRKYFDGTVSAPKTASEIDRKFTEEIAGLSGRVRENMRRFKTADALKEIIGLARLSNKYIDDTAPWILAKNAEDRQKLNTVLYNLAESLRVIGVALASFMPETSGEILTQIGAKKRDYESIRGYSEKEVFSVSTETHPLFARIDEEKFLKEYHAQKALPAEKQQVQSAEEADKKNEITIGDFDKIALKVAEVAACEKVEKSDKLLKLTVRIGAEERTVVSGIAKHYTPEQMIGKKVVLVYNLKPAKLRGIESQGMVLCAEDKEGRVILLSPECDVESGADVF